VLRVSLLGEQVIADDATGAVLTRSPRSVALVAYLVVHAGLAQPRRRIAGLFWPDSTDAQALTNLRRELHQLRQVLGELPSLAVTGRDLCWRDTPASRVDVREFDVARRAALTAGTRAACSPTLTRRWPPTAASCCRAWPTTGSWPRVPSWTASASNCAT
jgi:DNA-binding SARP family transcriptional activator